MSEIKTLIDDEAVNFFSELNKINQDLKKLKGINRIYLFTNNKFYFSHTEDSYFLSIGENLLLNSSIECLIDSKLVYYISKLLKKKDKLKIEIENYNLKFIINDNVTNFTDEKDIIVTPVIWDFCSNSYTDLLQTSELYFYFDVKEKFINNLNNINQYSFYMHKIDMKFFIDKLNNKQPIIITIENDKNILFTCLHQYLPNTKNLEEVNLYQYIKEDYCYFNLKIIKKNYILNNYLKAFYSHNTDNEKLKKEANFLSEYFN